MDTLQQIFNLWRSRRGASSVEFAVIAFAAVLILLGLLAFTGFGFMLANRIRGLIVGT